LIGGVVGFGLSISMEKQGVGLFNRETSAQALGYLSIFSAAWTVLTTVLMAYFGE
jgi:hypothetical protein